jgi:hypothetical protein
MTQPPHTSWLAVLRRSSDACRAIPTQFEDGHAMAAEQGWTVCGEHRDEGFSAYSGNRGAGLA